MTVTTSINYKEYQADGLVTTFPIPFLLLNDNDLQVYINNTLVTMGYSIKGTGNPISEIIFSTPPKGRLLLQRNITLLRDTDYQENGDLLANTVNRDFDRIYLALQGASQNINKNLRVDDAEGISSLSYAIERANKLLAFDNQGQPLFINTISGSALELAKELADSSQATNGAAMLGYNSQLNYPAKTVGSALQNMNKITISSEAPDNTMGIEGEIWLQLEEK